MHRPMCWEIIRITATFAGTLIGAGFASGQELMQFFAAYGPTGLLGICLSAVLFCWLGAQILAISNHQKFPSYHQIFYYVCGQKLGFILDICSGIFLLVGFTVMLAGAGTVGSQFLNIPYYVSLVGGILLLTCALAFGIHGITLLNLICTPLLVIFIIIVSINSLDYHSDLLLLAPLQPQILLPQPCSHWLLASILYVSYNLVLAATVTTQLGAQAKRRQACIWGGIGGGILLGILALFVTAVILLHQPEIFITELPMLYVAAQQTPLSYLLYGYALLIAMLTTAAASLYGCTTKIQAITGLPYPVNLTIILLLGLLLSHLGFSNLISLVYPIFGYIAALFILKLIYRSVRDILSH